jgi:acetyl esterase
LDLGSKDDIANYGRILAARGYAVVGVDYSIAPGAKYPKPVQQVNTALAYLVTNGSRLHLNTSNIVLAGDSAGAHIAAQLANVVSVPSYAELLGITPAISRLQLRGLVLFCGAYDVQRVRAALWRSLCRDPDCFWAFTLS